MYTITSGLVSHYLAALSQGPQSFPECKVTAVLFLRMMHDVPDIKRILDMSPFFAIQQRLPMKDDTYIPLTLHVAAVLAMAQFKEWNSDTMREHMKSYGKQILSSPGYRKLFAILSPTFVTMGAGLRYSNDFKGVKASGKMLAKNTAQMTISNPAHIFPPFYVDSYNGIFEASLEAASAKEAKSAIKEVVESGSVSVFTWTS